MLMICLAPRNLANDAVSRPTACSTARQRARLQNTPRTLPTHCRACTCQAWKLLRCACSALGHGSAAPVRQGKGHNQRRHTRAGAPDGDAVALADLAQLVGVPRGGQDVRQEDVHLVALALRHLQQVDIRCRGAARSVSCGTGAASCQCNIAEHVQAVLLHGHAQLVVLMSVCTVAWTLTVGYTVVLRLAAIIPTSQMGVACGKQWWVINMIASRSSTPRLPHLQSFPGMFSAERTDASLCQYNALLLQV